jgi:general secretion pathway protein C
LLTLAALAVFGLVLAYWTWIWFAPRAEPRGEVVAAESGNLATAGLVFGRLELNKSVAAPTGIAIKLLGVVAASGGRRGYAVVQLDGKQILAPHEGDDVTPGLRLAEVHPDHVILERGGVREMLAWPQKPATSTPSKPLVQPAAPPAAVPVVPPAAVSTAPIPAEAVAVPAAQPVVPRGRRSAGRQTDTD